MAEIIKLSCPACGAKLEISEDIERFACLYCGNEHMVIRRGGIVSLKPVVEGLERVRVGTDRTASELALVRLDREIGQLRTDLAAAKPKWHFLWLTVPFGCLSLVTLMMTISDASEDVDSACLAGLLVPAITLFLVWLNSHARSRSRRRELEPLLEAKRDEYHKHYLLLDAIDSAEQTDDPGRTVGGAG